MTPTEVFQSLATISCQSGCIVIEKCGHMTWFGAVALIPVSDLDCALVSLN